MIYKEKAFYLNSNASKLNMDGFDRLYIGDEFCERLLPELPELTSAIDFCAQNKLGLTLVTPYLSNKGIDVLRECLDFMVDKNLRFEVVINDWGVFQLLRDYHLNLKLILGRILVSQYLSRQHAKPDRDNLNLRKEEKYLYCTFPEQFLSFLKTNGVSCLEFNRYQHLLTTQQQLRDFGFLCHIYYPFEYLTTSRHCAYVKNSPFYMHSTTQNCCRECLRYIAFKRSRFIDKEIIIKGNTHFIKRIKDISKLKCSVDRIIHNDFLHTASLQLMNDGPIRS